MRVVKNHHMDLLSSRRHGGCAGDAMRVLAIPMRVLAILPEGLKVRRDLILHGCKGITSLPKGLEVGHNLDLNFSDITSLPKGLKVLGYISLIGTSVQEIPADAVIGKGIHGLTPPPEVAAHTRQEGKPTVRSGGFRDRVSRSSAARDSHLP
jgi:hypothetical protein